jgi:UDP-N-acetyl-D-mannosaminuronic acid dehydrogenase
VTPEAAELAASLYATFCQGEILLTDDITAEMAKLVENSYRDVNIAFANELSIISDGLGIDVWELIRLANHHPRVNILQPGPGVGGHCIAVDPWFIVAEAPEDAKLIRTARMVNDAKPLWVVDKVIDALEAAPLGTEVAVLGLAFKANIDDLRESPAIEIAKMIAQRVPETVLNVVEPHVVQLPEQLRQLDNVKLTDLSIGLKSSGVVVLLVDHDDFKTAELMDLEGKSVIDTRGILTY